MDCKDKILSNDYYDTITDYPIIGVDGDYVDFCYTDIEDLYSVVYINRISIPNPLSNFYDYQSIPKLYGLMQRNSVAAGFDPNSLIASGITQVQRQPLNLTGRGCVICFIDTGINYQNEAFLDENGESRILAIWDQTIQDGTPPEGFLYGTEYTREDINRALQSSDPYSIVPSRDEIGHGSAMAGVAAGSRINSGLSYLGAAPDAELVVVKLKECKPYLREYYLVPPDVPAYQENDIMLAVAYAESFARTFRRPLVICLGLGTNMGDHSRSSFLARYISAVAVRRSRVVVVTGGNEGNAGHHFQGMLQERTDGSESREDVEIRVGAGSIGFTMELWGNVPDVFNVSIRSPGGESISPLRLALSQSITYSFIYERTRITVDSTLVEPASGEQLIRFRVQDPTEGIWTFRIFSVGEVHNGNFNLWLPITAFLNTQVYFLSPSPYITLTEPSTASDIISVSTYNAENDSFYTESGRGYARTGAVRPDFAAPGVNVSTIYGRETGSSLSAAITAGAAAQFMQWAVVQGNDENAESREVRNYFIRGASRESDINYPNREWGYGRLNMSGTFDALINV
ncbi:MAG: S8 family peptidase [Candidatus Gastranaerophilales bacterium]|nr:S8 family peptidase [Candidatus Gastranaerophilales bacterium]